MIAVDPTFSIYMRETFLEFLYVGKILFCSFQNSPVYKVLVGLTVCRSKKKVGLRVPCGFVIYKKAKRKFEPISQYGLVCYFGLRCYFGR